MGEKKFFIKCRQSGKTNSLINRAIEGLKSSKNVFFFTINHNEKNRIEKTIKLMLSSFGCSNNFLCNLNVFSSYDQSIETLSIISSTIKKSKNPLILIDEYLFFSEESQSNIDCLIQRLKKNKIDFSLFCYSTPFKQINKDLISTIRLTKSSEEKIDIFDYLSVEYKEEYTYLYNNLLTDPDVGVFDDNANNFKLYESKEQFEMERWGKLFKD